MSLPGPGANGTGGGGRPAPTPNQAQDAWSVRIATVSGIPIRLHFTFLLILTFFALTGINRGGGVLVLFLIGLFLCVALHELGHSLVAQRLGYQVRDIVLYPIGGVASIEGMPEPRHELAIAVAGPAVNVVIAGALAVYLAAVGAPFTLGQMETPQLLQGSLLASLLRANVYLVLFNLIPAFPMDGGRILRALLALSIGRARATRIAGSIGQALAIALGIYGFLLPNLGLMIIALFVFFGAGQETAAEQSRVVVEGAPVGAAMVREFQTLGVGDSLRRAAELLLATSQQDFPVVHGDTVVGVLSRGALLRGLAQEGENAYVSGVMDRDVAFAAPGDSLENVLTQPGGFQRAPILVMDDDHRLVGMLTSENLMEFLTLRQIAQARAEQMRDGQSAR